MCFCVCMWVFRWAWCNRVSELSVRVYYATISLRCSGDARVYARCSISLRDSVYLYPIDSLRGIFSQSINLGVCREVVRVAPVHRTGDGLWYGTSSLNQTICATMKPLQRLHGIRDYENLGPHVNFGLESKIKHLHTHTCTVFNGRFCCSASPSFVGKFLLT